LVCKLNLDGGGLAAAFIKETSFMRALALLMVLLSVQSYAADFSLPGLTLGETSSTNEPDTELFGMKLKAKTELNEGKLSAVQIVLYQGTEPAAFVALLDKVAQQWQKDWQGLVLLKPDEKEPVDLTAVDNYTELKQFFTDANQLAEQYRSSHRAETILLVDVEPATQPDNCRLHLSLQYQSMSSSYQLVLYVDSKDAPSRNAEAVVNLQG